MSIFFKYNYISLLTKKYKVSFKTIYLEKYTKPYKTPLRITIYLLVSIFFDTNTYFRNSLKSLLTVNVLYSKFLHHLLASEILIN